MHPTERVVAAFALDFAELNRSEIGRVLGVPRRTVSMWLARGELEHVVTSPMRSAVGACESTRCALIDRQEPDSYAYLLGLYLGDGCLSTGPRGGFRLRIVQDARYTGLIELCAETMEIVGVGKVARQPREGCVEIYAHGKHWPCLFPQHAPGRKHDRVIELVAWQQVIVARAPFALLRGLIHSDGCRAMNRVVVRGKQYEYSRYFLSNRSADIRRLFVETCTTVGIRARNNGKQVSVARRADVALLDANGCRKV